MVARRRILISGASSGIGAQLAREYAARGRDLALCARRVDRLTALRDELTARHPGVRVVVRELDVADVDRVGPVFRDCAAELGGLDRVIVNAGTASGAPLGTGRAAANLAAARTNFLGGLAQCEAALELFRPARAGHLVVVASMGAFRGLPRSVTTYAATKAGMATLAEGLRADLLDSPIAVTTLYPGYVRSEMNPPGVRNPLLTETEPAVRSMVRAIERETPEANVPPWPWNLLSFALKHLPLRVVARFA